MHLHLMHNVSTRTILIDSADLLWTPSGLILMADKQPDQIHTALGLVKIDETRTCFTYLFTCLGFTEKPDAHVHQAEWLQQQESTNKVNDTWSYLFQQDCDHAQASFGSTMLTKCMLHSPRLACQGVHYLPTLDCILY